jgi:hypothetical protein
VAKSELKVTLVNEHDFFPVVHPPIAVPPLRVEWGAMRSKRTRGTEGEVLGGGEEEVFFF